MPLQTNAGGYNLGLYLRDSASGKILGLGPNQTISTVTFMYSKWNSLTSFNTNYLGAAAAMTYHSHTLWVRFTCDGTNYQAWISQDGVNFSKVHTAQTKTNFLTAQADEVGIFVEAVQGIAGALGYMNVFHYAQA
jgi:hypothetical protein